MHKKHRVWICILLLLLAAMPMYLLAQETEPEDPVFGGDQLLMDEETDRILSLQLSQNYTNETYYTFEKELPLSGRAEPHAAVRILVYTLDEESMPILWYQNELEIGSSGLMQETVPLPLMGTQWMLISVRDSQGGACRIYEMERKGEEILEDLLNCHLNLYEEFGR